MKRKSFLQAGAAVIGSTLLPSSSGATESSRKLIRFAHMSDIHVKPGAVPEAGMARALQHVQSKQKVDFIVNGGDLIMDALEADKSKTGIQWKLAKDILLKETSLPIYHTIGNHDIWGWFIKDNKPVNDPAFGKSWALETLGMKNRYYSFTREKWHFIVLDSTQLNPAGGYIALLDPEQLEWLRNELAMVPPGLFICIISHIPILSICAGLFFNRTEQNGDLLVKRNLMHSDFLILKNIFKNYQNIKVCISGHIHLQDSVEYLGIKYYCNGAVCGNWWHGAYQDFAPAYAVMELYDDGSCKRKIIEYDT